MLSHLIMELSLGCHGNFVRKNRKRFWMIILLCLLQSMCREHSIRCFQDVEAQNQN